MEICAAAGAASASVTSKPAAIARENCERGWIVLRVCLVGFIFNSPEGDCRLRRRDVVVQLIWHCRGGTFGGLGGGGLTSRSRGRLFECPKRSYKVGGGVQRVSPGRRCPSR